MIKAILHSPSGMKSEEKFYESEEVLIADFNQLRDQVTSAMPDKDMEYRYVYVHNDDKTVWNVYVKIFIGGEEYEGGRM